MRGRLMNNEFDFYFLESENKILVKNKDKSDMNFIISLDNLEVE